MKKTQDAEAPKIAKYKFQFWEIVTVALQTNLFPQSFGRCPFDGQLSIIGNLRIHFGQTKVTDLRHIFARHEHVTSCQVSVNQLFGLQILHPLTHITASTYMETHSQHFWPSQKMFLLSLSLKFHNSQSKAEQLKWVYERPSPRPEEIKQASLQHTNIHNVKCVTNDSLFGMYLIFLVLQYIYYHRRHVFVYYAINYYHEFLWILIKGWTHWILVR